MKTMTLLVAVLFLAVQVSADIMVDGETEDDFTLLDLPGGIRAGQLEVTPLLSMSFSGDDLIYRAGASVGLRSEGDGHTAPAPGVRDSWGGFSAN